ncbi:MAG: hypothetical protein ACK5OB_06680 [Pirellula sp.]
MSIRIHPSSLFVAVLVTLGATMLVGSSNAETIRIDIARDTWLSNVDAEKFGSNGGASRLKLKSIQELSIIDFQTGPLRGKKVTKAKLMIKNAADEPIERVTISTITCDWVEGKGSSYQVLDGVSTFSHRIYPKTRWNDSDLTAVCIGHGGSMYASVDAKASKESGWLELEIPPALIEARAAGLSYGLVLMDDTGSTWTRKGEEFKRKMFPNRFIFSRDSNRASALYLLVDIEPWDETTSPTIPEPTKLRLLEPDPVDPRPRAAWNVPPNEHSQLLGFLVNLGDAPVDQFLVPALSSHQQGDYVMPLDRILANAPSDQPIELQIRCVARNGKTSQPARLRVQKPNPAPIALTLQPFAFPDQSIQPKIAWEKGLQGNTRRWTVVDPLDTLLPKSQQWIPAQRASYVAANHLWDAKTKTITLDSPRGGWVGFQLACDSAPQSLQLAWNLDLSVPDLPRNASDEILKAIRSEWSSYETVPNKEEPTPDPLVQIANGNHQLRGKWKKSSTIAGQSWLFEVYIPQQLAAGTYPSRLQLDTGDEIQQWTIHIRVHDAVLPNELSFLPEMNCYGLPEQDLGYYRLGHRHRVVLNRVPYNQRGQLAQHVSPVWRNGVLDWEAFDARYGKLFTGEAFADLPRGPVPMECFYFAMHENWPTPMESNYNGSYWADQAFPTSYRDAWVSAVAQSAEHVHEQKWNKTRFHVFLNNKVDFKSNGWSRGSSPWLLDEPANFQDFVALNYFGLAFRDGMRRAAASLKQPIPNVMYRCDISRPQWQRDTLDQLMAYNVVSQTSFREYRNLVLDRKFRDAQTLVIYGGNNPIGTNNAMAVAWSWDAWCLGTDGVLPWQTIGTKDSWSKADELSLFYPHPTDGRQPPIPSIRLKAYCYGQQDVEILAMLAKQSRCDRYAFGEHLQKSLQFKAKGKTEGGYVEPAAWNDYGNLTPEILHHWRVQWLQLASAKN